MASLNKVFLLGNLTGDPDLRSLPSGQSVCELRLAVSRHYTSNGREGDETCFVDVVVWGRSANNCKQYLAKGSPVLIEGRLQYDQWEDRNGGGKRSKLRVVAEQVQFVGRRPQNDGENQEPAPSYYQQAPQQHSYGNYNNAAKGSYSAFDAQDDGMSASPFGGASASVPPMPEAGTDAPPDNIPF